MPLIALVAAAAVYADMPAVHKYEEELAVHCPRKQLQMASPEMTAKVFEKFPGTLTRRNRDAVRRQVYNECHKQKGDATCRAVATLRAAYRLSLVPKLAGQTCSLNLYCTGPRICGPRS